MALSNDNYISLFSIRNRQSVLEGQLKLSLPRRLRKRIWLILKDYDRSICIHPDPFDNWTQNSTVLEELPKELLKAYGEDKLIAFIDDDGTRGETRKELFLIPAKHLKVS